MSTQRQGLVYGLAAYGLWGLFPLYWPLLRPAGAVEILAHRIVWSLLVVIALFAVRRASTDLAALRRLALAAVVLSANWGVYIYGVNSAQVVETSLGYFVNPLVTVVLGVVVLRERLRRPQWIAVGIAALAVAVLTADYGHVPVIALTLAGSFGCYGLLKKQANAGALEGLTVETSVLFLPALGYLVVLAARGSSSFGVDLPHDLGHDALLAGAGVVTAVPLLFFGAATTRIPLTLIGLLQYVTPIMQLAIGVLLRHEPMPPARLAGFALVWLALAVLTADGLRNHRRQTRLTSPARHTSPVVSRVCRRWSRSPSAASTANARRTRANPASRAGGIGSCRSSTPIASCMIGVTYCNSPINVSGIRVVAAPKNSSGTAVTTPAPASSASWPRSWGRSTPKLDEPRAASTTRYPSAGRNSTLVSTVRPSSV